HSERAGGSVVRGLALIGLMVALAAAGVGTAGSSQAVGWCGSDESAVDRLPDAVSAQQIHVVYAVPSDGASAVFEDAPLIVSDLAGVDGWWRREDPTRTPRFDLFAFPGCAGGLEGLDLSNVRLPHDTAYYQPIEQRSDKLRTD